MSIMHSSNHSLDSIREPVEEELKRFDGVFFLDNSKGEMN